MRSFNQHRVHSALRSLLLLPKHSTVRLKCNKNDFSPLSESCRQPPLYRHLPLINHSGVEGPSSLEKCIVISPQELNLMGLRPSSKFITPSFSPAECLFLFVSSAAKNEALLQCGVPGLFEIVALASNTPGSVAEPFLLRYC